jgi:hypothetical protein
VDPAATRSAAGGSFLNAADELLAAKVDFMGHPVSEFDTDCAFSIISLL